MSVPFKKIFPPVGDSKPPTNLKAVVFPQPDGPSKQKNSPRSILRSKGARRNPEKSFVRPFNSSGVGNQFNKGNRVPSQEENEGLLKILGTCS